MSCNHIRLLIFVAAGFLCGLTSVAGSKEPETLKIGSIAPDFGLPGVDGKTYILDSFRDAEILVIVFTCDHCPTAQAYEDRIKRLAADYKDKHVALVAISPNDPTAVRLDEMGYTDVGDSFEDMKLRAKDKEFDFPYLYDGENQKVALAYGPVATPHVFVFDRARKLRFVGRIDNSEDPRRIATHETRDAIEALLAGKPVAVEQTKVFGCSIKWAEKRDTARKADEAWAKEEVSLKSIDENGIRALVKNDGDKLRLVNVWATWCGPCIEELPELVAIDRMYHRRRFELVTISADAPEAKDEALKALKEKRVAASNYLFDGNDKYKLMDAVDEKAPGALPYTLLVAPGGKVLYRKSGPIDALEVKKAIIGFVGRITYADDVPAKSAPAAVKPRGTLTLDNGRSSKQYTGVPDRRTRRSRRCGESRPRFCPAVTFMATNQATKSRRRRRPARRTETAGEATLGRAFPVGHIVPLGGFPVLSTTQEAFAEELFEALSAGEPRRVFFANTNFVVQCQALRDRMNEPSVRIVNDGLGMDLAAMLVHGRSFAGNLNGTDLIPHLCRQAPRPLKLFLLGGRPGIAVSAATALRAWAETSWAPAMATTNSPRLAMRWSNASIAPAQTLCWWPSGIPCKNAGSSITQKCCRRR